jgi:hypothetical protein
MMEARTVPPMIPRKGIRSQNLGIVDADVCHAGAMDNLRMQPAFTGLYDDAKETLAQGYRRADQLVYNFAMDYDIPPEDAWRLITQEASQRGEDVIQYLSENPLDERSYKLKNRQRQAGRVAGKCLDHLSEWFRDRGGRRQ